MKTLNYSIPIKGERYPLGEEATHIREKYGLDYVLVIGINNNVGEEHRNLISEDDRADRSKGAVELHQGDDGHVYLPAKAAALEALLAPVVSQIKAALMIRELGSGELADLIEGMFKEKKQ